MDNITFKVTEYNINIYRDLDQEYKYEIPLNALEETRDGSDSDWILHLNDKDWMTKDALYRLAKIIQDKAPNNSLDWHSTFYSIEMDDYHDSPEITAESKTISLEKKVKQIVHKKLIHDMKVVAKPSKNYDESLWY